jgi:hypothetical protein
MMKMKHPPIKLDPGDIHNTMLGQAKDTVRRIEGMPSLMLDMLKSEGWRILVRPADGRRFENKTLEDWILGRPWPGLDFPDWATLYGILRCNLDCGGRVIEKLHQCGAPSLNKVTRELEAERAEKTPLPGKGANQYTGGCDNITSSKRGTALKYTLRRLERDHPKLFAAYKRGELSANAAAIEAGFRKKPVKRCPKCGHEW